MKIFVGLFAIVVLISVLIINNFWKPDFNSKLLIAKYSEEEIEHFGNFAFQYGKLRKWQSNVKYNIEKYSNRSDLMLELTNICIQVLDTLLDEIEILPDSINCNLIINFLDTLKNDRTGFGLTHLGTFSFFVPSIKTGEIEVYTGDRNIEVINLTILHEFSHILGFHHNFLIEYQSVFNPQPKKIIETSKGTISVPSFDSYSDLDKAAIRIMYDEDVAIDPGLTKEKFFRLIEEARAEMEQK